MTAPTPDDIAALVKYLRFYSDHFAGATGWNSLVPTLGAAADALVALQARIEELERALAAGSEHGGTDHE